MQNLSYSSSVVLTSEVHATATIHISDHVLQLGQATLAYRGAILTDLVPDTAYYVYCDDPHYTGGELDYHATTDANDVLSPSNGRVYVGQVHTARAN